DQVEVAGRLVPRHPVVGVEVPAVRRDHAPPGLRVAVPREAPGRGDRIRDLTGSTGGEGRDPDDVPDVEAAVGPERDVDRPLELARPLALSPDLAQELAVRRIDPDRGPDPIGHVDAPRVVRRDGAHVPELVRWVALLDAA